MKKIVREVGSSPYACALWNKKVREENARAFWEGEKKKRKTCCEDEDSWSTSTSWSEEVYNEARKSFS